MDTTGRFVIGYDAIECAECKGRGRGCLACKEEGYFCGPGCLACQDEKQAAREARDERALAEWKDNRRDAR